MEGRAKMEQMERRLEDKMVKLHEDINNVSKYHIIFIQYSLLIIALCSRFKSPAPMKTTLS